MPSFKLQNLPPTPVEKLDELYKIAKDVGLKYVYIGNVPGSEHENTYCPNCGKLIIKRHGYWVWADGMADDRCRYCGYAIEGIWKR